MCTLKHALWFKNAGHEIFGVCLKDSPLEKHFIENQIPFLSLQKTGYLSFRESLLLRKFLVSNRIEIIFVHHLKNLWRLRLSLIGLSKIRVFGFARMFLKNVNKKDFLHRWIYSRLEKLIALTHIQAKALMDCLPISEDQLKVIPDSVDTKSFSKAKRSPGFRKSVFLLNEDEKAIGLVGRIDPQKGSQEFIESAVELLGVRPNLKFFLIGKETPDTPGFEKKLKDYVSSKGLEKRIQFLGHRSDVDVVIANLDVFVMPSYEETFGDVLIEAMSCEVPVIATRAGGPIDIVDHMESGILIPPKEHDAITKAVKVILDDKELSAKMIQNARQKALHVYDEKIVFGEIQSLFKQY